MSVLTKAVWSVVRLGLLAGAIVFAGVGIGQESQPASASHTKVLFSYSNIWPSQTQLFVVNPDGLPREIYVWAVNVDNATGVSSYHLEIGFDGSAFTVAGGTDQVDIIDGRVDVDESGAVDEDDGLFNLLLPLLAGGTDQVDIIDGKVDVDESGTVDAADDLAGVLLRRDGIGVPSAGSPKTVEIIDGKVDVDESGAVDAADDLANALLLTAFEAPPSPMWLGPGWPERSASCPSPTIETNRVYMDCVTPGSVPPYGATGTGLIGKLIIQPLSCQLESCLDSPLDLTGTFLGDTPDDPDDLATIPVTLLSSYVVYRGCADVNGDGLIDLVNDILGVIDHWQVPPEIPDGSGGWIPNPDWDPAYDINDDELVEITPKNIRIRKMPAPN